MTKNLSGFPAFHTQEAFEMPVASSKLILPSAFFFQIALAIGVLTSSWGVRVRRFCGFVAVGCHTGSRWRSRWRCNLLMCVGVRGLQI